MQGCGGCSVQEVSQLAQILLNPVTWTVALAGILAMTSKTKKKEK